MDLSFAMQALSAQYILNEDLKPGVHRAPDEIDFNVAKLKLAAMDIEIDQLSPRQVEYLDNWEEGT
jgi:adenosylhomocysteinase